MARLRSVHLSSIFVRRATSQALHKEQRACLRPCPLVSRRTIHAARMSSPRRSRSLAPDSFEIAALRVNASASVAIADGALRSNTSKESSDISTQTTIGGNPHPIETQFWANGTRACHPCVAEHACMRVCVHAYISVLCVLCSTTARSAAPLHYKL